MNVVPPAVPETAEAEVQCRGPRQHRGRAERKRWAEGREPRATKRTAPPPPGVVVHPNGIEYQPMGEKQKRKLTDLDFSIMEEITKNPYAESKDLCKELNIEIRNLEGKLHHLRELGLLTKWQRTVDLPATGCRLRYRIDITINPNVLQHSQDIIQLRGKYKTENCQELLAYYIRDVVAEKCSEVFVEEVSILLGDPADLCATVLVPDHKTIFTFITEHLRARDEIKSTSTSHVAWRVFRKPVAEADSVAEQSIAPEVSPLPLSTRSRG